MAKISDSPENEMTIDNEVEEPARSPRSRFPIWIAIPIGIAVGSLAGVGIGSVVNARLIQNSGIQANLSDGGAKSVGEKAVKLTPEVMNAFVWSIRIRLDDLGLGRMLHVASEGDRKVVITGNLPKNYSGRYEIFKGWLASQPDYPPMTDEVNVLKTSGEFPTIVSVWLGDAPKLILENGTEAGIGERFGKDWTIVDIGALAVILERPDGMMIELSYQEG